MLHLSTYPASARCSSIPSVPTNRADLLDEQASRSENGETEKCQVRQQAVGSVKELLHIFISTSPGRRERDTICMNLGPIAVPECGGVDG